MKKIILIITVAFLGIILTACADRTPFKEQEVLKNKALVYVYVVKTVSTDDSSYDEPYSIKIDDKPITPKIMQSEYIAYDLQPIKIKFSAIKGAAVSKDIELDLKPQDVYYLRVKGSQEDESFSFEVVQSKTALKEIAKTGVAGSNFIFENEDKPEGVIETTPKQIEPKSSADEIQRLYDMKEKGILSQEEFDTLKAKVINK